MVWTNTLALAVAALQLGSVIAGPPPPPPPPPEGPPPAGPLAEEGPKPPGPPPPARPPPEGPKPPGPPADLPPKDTPETSPPPPNAPSADPTYPQPWDALEDILYLNMGYNAKELAQPFTPCDLEPTNGFNPAAGMIRCAFHDAAPYNAAARTGGLDASIAFELTGEAGKSNGGPFVANTLGYLSRYLSDQVSMADAMAASLGSAVRSCGGPVIPIRYGRVDATSAGDLGVPNVKDSTTSMIATFKRMGFTTEDMIKLTACGHTVGGVHPQLHSDDPSIPQNSVNHFDHTQGQFDNGVVTDYLGNKSIDDLVITNAINSDKRIFESDNGTTVHQLADSNKFAQECEVLLQRMIELVPGKVQLSAPIVPYELKPAEVELSLSKDGKTLTFYGEVRVRTTERALDEIESVEIVYYGHDGKEIDTIATEFAGTASGHDDTFAFFGWSEEIDAKDGVAAFTVIITGSDGKALTYNNNGNKYAVEDSVFVDRPASSIGKVDGRGKVPVEIVAVTRGEASEIQLKTTTHKPRDDLVNPMPILERNTYPMKKDSTNGEFTVYKAQFLLTKRQYINIVKLNDYSATFDVVAIVNGKEVKDLFNKVAGLKGTESVPDLPEDDTPKPPPKPCTTEAEACPAQPWATDSSWAIPTPSVHTKPHGPGNGGSGGWGGKPTAKPGHGGGGYGDGKPGGHNGPKPTGKPGAPGSGSGNGSGSDHEGPDGHDSDCDGSWNNDSGSWDDEPEASSWSDVTAAPTNKPVAPTALPPKPSSGSPKPSGPAIYTGAAAVNTVANVAVGGVVGLVGFAMVML